MTWVEISQSAFRYNIRLFQRLLRSTRTGLMAVVKSNAYGHGMIEIARLAQQQGVRWFGVVNSTEALALRSAGIWSKILVLSYTQRDQLTDLIRKRISLCAYNLESAKVINDVAGSLRLKAFLHAKIDTGTSRLGERWDAAVPFIMSIQHLPHVELEGLFTHYADSENPHQRFTQLQTKRLLDVTEALARKKVRVPYIHASCSASTLLNPRTRFSLSRVGISLYGLSSIQKDHLARTLTENIRSLRPVLSWHTRVLQVKTLRKGESVGYGRTYRTKRAMRTAVLPVGYWEGYDRKLSNCGIVLIRGKRAPVIGRVCMNLTMIDVSFLGDVHAGDRVTLIGRQKKASITADEIARQTETINYEVITRINSSIPRILVK